MRMRTGLLRLLRLAFIAVAAFVALRTLDPRGLGWVVPALAALAVLTWFVLRRFAARRRAREDADADRWAEALLDSPLRPSAIRELRQAIERLDPARRKDAPQHARLSLVLAELLEADGEPNDALAVLDAVRDGALPERTVLMVRHARAVASLSAGDIEGAAAMVQELHPIGERALDIRIRALRGFVMAEQGEGERALELAEELRLEAGADAELRMEARVLKAAALDALGDGEEAVKVMRALGEEMLGVLLVLGLPRVKALADRALDEED